MKCKKYLMVFMRIKNLVFGNKKLKLIKIRHFFLYKPKNSLLTKKYECFLFLKCIMFHSLNKHF